MSLSGATRQLAKLQITQGKTLQLVPDIVLEQRRLKKIYEKAHNSPPDMFPQGYRGYKTQPNATKYYINSPQETLEGVCLKPTMKLSGLPLVTKRHLIYPTDKASITYLGNQSIGLNVVDYCDNFGRTALKPNKELFELHQW